MAGLCYSVGYVPRSLKKKLYRSSQCHKDILIFLLKDLLDERYDDDNDDSTDWINLIDKGGLKRVNNDTYQLFVALEMQLHKEITSHHIPALDENCKQTLLNDDNIRFFWSIVCTESEEEVGNILLWIIVNEWVTIREFSFANYWIEKYSTNGTTKRLLVSLKRSNYQQIKLTKQLTHYMCYLFKYF